MICGYCTNDFRDETISYNLSQYACRNIFNIETEQEDFSVIIYPPDNNIFCQGLIFPKHALQTFKNVALSFSQRKQKAFMQLI